jgi:hypothetical protein
MQKRSRGDAFAAPLPPKCGVEAQVCPRMAYVRLVALPPSPEAGPVHG